MAGFFDLLALFGWKSKPAVSVATVSERYVIKGADDRFLELEGSDDRYLVIKGSEDTFQAIEGS